MTRLGDIDPKAWVEANQKIILLEDLNRQAESRIAFLETENRKLFAETGAADRLLEAAIEYTTNRQYQNVEACRKDQDRLEGILIHWINQYRQAKSGGGA